MMKNNNYFGSLFISIDTNSICTSYYILLLQDD